MLNDDHSLVQDAAQQFLESYDDITIHRCKLLSKGNVRIDMDRDWLTDDDFDFLEYEFQDPDEECGPVNKGASYASSPGPRSERRLKARRRNTELADQTGTQKLVPCKRHRKMYKKSRLAAVDM